MILWTISTRKIDTPRIFLLAVLFFGNDFIPKNYTPYPIIGNVSGSWFR